MDIKHTAITINLDKEERVRVIVHVDDPEEAFLTPIEIEIVNSDGFAGCKASLILGDGLQHFDIGLNGLTEKE